LKQKAFTRGDKKEVLIGSIIGTQMETKQCGNIDMYEITREKVPRKFSVSLFGSSLFDIRDTGFMSSGDRNRPTITLPGRC